MNTLMRRALLGASILTPLALTPLAAQTQLETEAPLTDQDEDEDLFPTAEDPGIIVTARKREESLQSVPTSVAVVTDETIQNLALDSLEEIANTTAGLIFNESLGRGDNRPVIRGQSSILGESGVAFFIDGIYYTGSLADYDVDSIERIEVVKGPQSALYGRNTYSGALNIISKLPGDVWEGRVTADIAEFDRYEITAGIRGPLTDGLSVGLNGRFYDFGGEFENAFDGSEVGQQSSYSASGILAWDNGGPFRANLRGYYNRTDDGQGAIFMQGAEFNNCLPDDGGLYNGGGRYFCGPIQPGTVDTDFSRQFVDADDVGLEADTYNVSLRMEYDLSDRLQLVSLTGYNDRTSTLLTDGDYSPTSFQTAVFARFPIGAPVGFGPAGPIFPFGFVGTTVDFSFAQRSETSDWSQELQLQYEGDGFDVLLGGYYFDQSNDTFDIRELPADAAARAGASFGATFGEEIARCAANPSCDSIVPLFGPGIRENRSENLLDIRNIAVFGAVSIELAPGLNLGLEGRYAEEQIDQSAFIFFEGDARPDPVLAEATFTKFSPRVTLDWQFTPDNMVYAIYAEGQKPGGFNGANAIRAAQDETLAPDDPIRDIATFSEEENAQYEIGLKNVFADGRVVFNLAGFYTEIEGYQLTQNVSVPPNQESITVNAGDAEIFGLEAEFVGRISDRVTLTANYALADTEFTSGFDEQVGVLNDVADDRQANCSTGDEFPELAGCQSAFGSIEGQRIPRAPVHSVFADLDYRAPIGSGDWEFFTGANVALTSSSFAQVSNLAFSGDATEVDARIGVTNNNYRLQFYVDNLFDEDAVQQVLRFADGDQDFRRSFVAGLRPGRRFGVILSAQY
ncbi:MAG: TonB-dependent receptor [Erythrobacter sp.]